MPPPHPQIYQKLTESAHQGALVTYGELVPLAHLNLASPADRNTLSEMLGEISTCEHDHGRPMLSAIVVHAEDGQPGRGFFNLARELGSLHGSSDQAAKAEAEKEIVQLNEVSAYGEIIPAPGAPASYANSAVSN
jgi:hypothetical protein